MNKEVIERKHVRLFDPKEHIVSQILNDLGDKQKSAAHLLRRWGRDETLHIRCYYCWTEEAQEYECSDGRIFGVGETRLYRVDNLERVSELAFIPASASEELTILHSFRNDAGMFDVEAQMSSMKTLATIRSCKAFFWDSSGDPTRAGSSSRSRS